MVARTWRLYNRKGGTAAKYPVQSTVNKPVKKIYKKRAAPTKVNLNKQAIMKLSNQVRLLQNQRAGEIQTHTMWAAVPRQGGNLGPVSPGAPLLFGLNNFYEQEIYKGIVVAQAAPLQDAPSFVTVTNFARNYYRSDLDDEFEWNARRNTDNVSTIEYKPVFTRLNFKFTFNTATAVHPGKVRVTILKLRPHSVSNKLNVSLPATLGAYRWLGNAATAQYHNHFDKTYHQVLVDKWISVRPPPNSALTQFTRELRLDYRYDATILKPDITVAPSGQNFWTNTPVKDQIWVLISADGEAQASMQEAYVSKFDVWRDPHGV